MESVHTVQEAMFANIAIAFLISLGIALVIFLVVKGLYSRFSPEALHILIAILAILGSTVAGTVAITSSKAYKYVLSLETGAKQVMSQADMAMQQFDLDQYGLSASAIADGYVSGTADIAKSKLSRARTLSIVIMVVLNLLMTLFLLNAASKGSARHSRNRSSIDDDDLDDLGSSTSFDDLDLD